MTKEEVIDIMGQPVSTKATEEIEIMEYMLTTCAEWDVSFVANYQYWVTLKDGKVITFGQAGDFGTAIPQDRREYNINVKQQ